MALTNKQARFVEEYLIDLNALQAAIRAGYSPDAAGNIGWENLQKPEIAKALQKAMDARSKRTHISQDRVLEELARLGFSDMRAFMTWGPGGVRLRESSELTEDDAACVAEVSETINQTGGSIRLKLHDKLSALEKIARHLGLKGSENPIIIRFVYDDEPE